MGRIVHLPDVPVTEIPDGRWQQLNERLGIKAFGVNGVLMDPGDKSDMQHNEEDSRHQEVYVVVTGRAAFRFGDGEEVEAGPGDVVAVGDPDETRDYRALEPGTRIVCFGAAEGAEHPYGEWIARDAAQQQ
jgi:mannose-6-phosphate isomerase-like protein (cupin superfamily)